MSGCPLSEKLAYTIEETSILVSLSRAQVYRLIDLGELQSITIGRSRRITTRQLQAFIEAKEASAVRVPQSAWEVVAGSQSKSKVRKAAE